MSKKKLNTSGIANELEGASAFFSKVDRSPAENVFKPSRLPETAPKPAREVTSVITHARDNARQISRELPSRDEIQEFSFRLRDELKVKVQAEVPHEWQDELEEIARDLKVKKLELYRFIFGEFLEKVKRNR